LYPQAEFRGLIDLVESLHATLRDEAATQAASCEWTPLLRSCLMRARGHLEIAQRALGEIRPAGTMPKVLRVPFRPMQADGARSLRLDSGAWNASDGQSAAAQGMWHASDSSGADAAGRASAELDAEGPDVFPEQPSNTWVQCRVEEIGRALEFALGEDLDHELGPESSNKPVHGRGSEPMVYNAAPPAPEAPPHFSGNTEVLSIPDLIGFFQAQSKTGVLEIQHSSECFRLEFEKGALVHSEASRSPDGERLGEILIRRGALTEERLSSLLENLARGERLGSGLMRLEGITEAELAGAIEEQVIGIFIRLSQLPGCSFAFRECPVRSDVVGQVRHNVTRLLLNSARHIDEALERRAS